MDTPGREKEYPLVDQLCALIRFIAGTTSPCQLQMDFDGARLHWTVTRAEFLKCPSAEQYQAMKGIGKKTT